MSQSNQDIIKKIYSEFNARNIDAVLAFMAEDVKWPNGWEGGYVSGKAAIRDYWTRQWKELNPKVEPVAFRTLPDGRFEVAVKQHIKDMRGVVVTDDVIKHIYTLHNGMIKTMEIDNNPAFA